MHDSSPSSIEDLDYSLEFWEFGPVRTLLEEEFLRLVNHERLRMACLTPEGERQAHDFIIPRVFQMVIQKTSSDVHDEVLRGNMIRALQDVLQEYLSRGSAVELENAPN